MIHFNWNILDTDSQFDGIVLVAVNPALSYFALLFIYFALQFQIVVEQIEFNKIEFWLN